MPKSIKDEVKALRQKYKELIDEDNFTTCGERIRFAREIKKWTIRDLSKESSVSIATISRMERNIEGIKLHTVYNLANVLQVSPSWLAFNNE